ncbi:vacuolar protein sorting 55 [Piedraia hortae CBS 480.64]|uniref:Vacuolar protein sorting 55 n=1 Tax=Piedraia hortae CBS 480.64 TaxID=1314780 RepID=A0A6A7BU17_9PEZI|nr:vacuolar protein sorting 55 [Piedraia hortae CBS 480.64]
MAGLKTIIILSFVLAIGILLVILSSALWQNYLPLLVVGVYIVAPIPNWICSRAGQRFDILDAEQGNYEDLGRFLTAFFVVMGIALPLVLFHTDQIRTEAMIMSIIGGLLIYSTIVAFGLFFSREEEF